MADPGDATDAQQGGDEALRTLLGQLLEGGLETESEPRADSSEAVNRMVGRLAAVAPGAWAALLTIAGVTPHPYVSDNDDDLSQACETCMYYGVHRRYCDLPELRMPVRPEWSCRLWRI